MKKNIKTLAYVFIIVNLIASLVLMVLLYPTLKENNITTIPMFIILPVQVVFAINAMVSLDMSYRNVFAGIILIITGNILGGIFYMLSLPERKEFNDVESSSHAEFQRKHMGIKAGNVTSSTIIYIFLIVMTVIWLFPFFAILCESLRMESTGQVGYIFPHQWGFGNYIKLWTETDFPKWYGNTMLMALIVAVLQTVIVLAMSYTLSRLRFKGRKGLMNFMLVLGMFPGFLTMIVLYTVLKDMGLTGPNAVPGLILVYVASSGMGYYVSKGFFDTLPRSLDEAARVDGATRFQVFYKVILPLSKPIIIYTILVAFMAPWGDFIFAKYIARTSTAGWNVAVGLKSWIDSKTLHDTNYTMFCAGGVCVALPVTLLFMFLQKYYVEGVTGGAVKG